MASTNRVTTPWFCVKSTLLGDTRPDSPPESQKKVFLNVCTQSSVPKAPEIPASVFQDRLESPSESDRSLIPIVLAEPKEDVDKGTSKPVYSTYCFFQLTSLHFLNPHLRVNSSGEAMPGYRLHHQSGEQGIGAEARQFIQDVPYWCDCYPPLTTPSTDKFSAPKGSSLIKLKENNLGGYREVRCIFNASHEVSTHRPPPSIRSLP